MWELVASMRITSTRDDQALVESSYRRHLSDTHAGVLRSSKDLMSAVKARSGSATAGEFPSPPIMASRAAHHDMSEYIYVAHSPGRDFCHWPTIMESDPSNVHDIAPAIWEWHPRTTHSAIQLPLRFGRSASSTASTRRGRVLMLRRFLTRQPLL